AGNGPDRRTAVTQSIVALLLLAAACPAANKAGSGLPPGSLAPAFALPDIHGRQVRLDDYRGQVVVLNFWAFWCDTWKAEMPHLQELIPQQEELGFRLIAISVDGTRLPEFSTFGPGARIDSRCCPGQHEVVAAASGKG